MRKTAQRVLLAGCAVLTAGFFAGCGKPVYSETEIRAALEELLPAAEELNEIYFGEGLPLTEDSEAREAFYASLDTDAVRYGPVDASCGYTTEQELREATLDVFTESYASYLFERAFRGISAVYDEGTEMQTTAAAMYAMYIEENGVLTVRVDLAEEAMELGRTYDLSGLEILRAKEDYVLVQIPTEQNGRALDVELKLIRTPEGWRLDSPTY